MRAELHSRREVLDSRILSVLNNGAQEILLLLEAWVVAGFDLQVGAQHAIELRPVAFDGEFAHGHIGGRDAARRQWAGLGGPVQLDQGVEHAGLLDVFNGWDTIDNLVADAGQCIVLHVLSHVGIIDDGRDSKRFKPFGVADSGKL